MLTSGSTNFLEDGFNTVEVFNSGELKSKKHTNLADGKPVLDPGDHTHLTAKLQGILRANTCWSGGFLSRDSHTAPRAGMIIRIVSH